MKATGEVMSIGVNFEQAMMKAVRSIELKLDTLSMPKLAPHTDEEIHGLLHTATTSGFLWCTRPSSGASPWMRSTASP